MQPKKYYTQLDITEYVNLKIQRNQLMLEMLELQNRMLKKEILANAGMVDTNNKKINILKEVNMVEEKQRHEFDQDVENSTLVHYEAINNMKHEKYDELRASILEDRNQLQKLITDVQNLSKQIPTVIITGD